MWPFICRHTSECYLPTASPPHSLSHITTFPWVSFRSAMARLRPWHYWTEWRLRRSRNKNYTRKMPANEFDQSYIYRAFKSGFEKEPVMCQTINTVFDKNYCPWVSCGEWCLTVCHFHICCRFPFRPIAARMPACSSSSLLPPLMIAFAPIKLCNSSHDDSSANISIKYLPCN